MSIPEGMFVELLMESSDISALYQKFGFVIYRRCRKLLQDPEQAADAAQEVFVRAVHHAKSLTFDRDCLPWLYRVATNYCLNLIRDRNAVCHLSMAATRDHGSGAQPDARFLAREQLALMMEGLDEVSSQIAVYYYMDQMTQEEIAEVTGLSRRTIGKKLKRFSMAVDRFRCLEQEA